MYRPINGDSMSITSWDMHVLLFWWTYWMPSWISQFLKGCQHCTLQIWILYNPKILCIDPHIVILCQLQAEICIFLAAILYTIFNISISQRVTRWHSSDLDSMTLNTHVLAQKLLFYVNYNLRYSRFVYRQPYWTPSWISQYLQECQGGTPQI